MRSYERYSQNDVSELIKSADGELKTAILLAAFAGLRYGEIVELKWNDIDYSQRILRVRSMKRNCLRIVPIHSMLMEQLTCWKDENPIGDEVFALAGVRARLQRKLRRLANFLKTERTGFHGFRRWLAGEMMSSGVVSIHAIAALLGQRQQPDTVRLTHITIEELWAAIKAREEEVKSHGHL